MRLKEICQFDVTDVRTVEEIDCICITRTSLVGSTDKNLKKNVSKRVIPLHPTLPTWVRRLRGGAPEGRADEAFHDIDTGSRGVRAVAFSRWFNSLWLVFHHWIVVRGASSGGPRRLARSNEVYRQESAAHVACWPAEATEANWQGYCEASRAIR